MTFRVSSSSLSYLLQTSLSFQDFDAQSNISIGCCHSNRFGKTLLAFNCTESPSGIIVCLSDVNIESEFDGGEENRLVQSSDDEDDGFVSRVVKTAFLIKDFNLSGDSKLVAIMTGEEVLVFHSSVFISSHHNDNDCALQV